MREDTFTNTVEDAAAYEALRGRDEWIDDRPTPAELEELVDPSRWPILWTCFRCERDHHFGDPLTDRCDCGFLLGEQP